MSQSEYQRFVADLGSNVGLCAEAEKATAKQAASALQAIASFAAGKGYSFTVEEAAKFVAAAKAKGGIKPLADVELDRIVGGAADEVSAAIADLFGRYAQSYQDAGNQASAFHQQFVQALNGSAAAYVEAEVAGGQAKKPTN